MADAVHIYWGLATSSQSGSHTISFSCHYWSSIRGKTCKLPFIDPCIFYLCNESIWYCFTELEFSNRLLEARNAVFTLPVSGWTNFTNVTSFSLLETSQTSSVRSPKYLALDISSNNCEFKTLPMRRNISLTEPAERCLKYLISSSPSCWRTVRRLVNFLFGISSLAIRYIASKVL